MGLDRSLTLSDIFPHPTLRGPDYNPAHILRIASYGAHFQLITKSDLLGVDLELDTIS